MADLPTINVAEKINTLHAEIMQSAKNMLQKIIEAGEMLTFVKQNLKHGTFNKWIEENLDVSTRTAQRYMKIYENRDRIKGIQIDKLSDAYKLLEKPKPKNDTRVAFDEPEMPDIIEDEPATENKVVKEKNQFEYWEYLEPLIEYMLRVYDVLASTRNHTTPVALGDMFGNIKEMAIRLDTWNPDNLQPCPKCNGEGTVIENGRKVKCEYCMNGLVGISKPTDY